MIYSIYAIKDRFGQWQAPMLFRDDEEAKYAFKKFFEEQKTDPALVKGSALYRIGNFDLFADAPLVGSDVFRVGSIESICEVEKDG